MADLLHLRHGKVCLDVVPVNNCVEKLSWAVSTGEACFQRESPTFMACLMALRERIDEEDVETMLMATIEAGQRSISHQADSVHRAVAESTVMSMAAPYLTDSRLPGKSRLYLMKLAMGKCLKVRKDCNPGRRELRFKSQAVRMPGNSSGSGRLCTCPRQMS
jgi:hypothetical protein